MMSSFDAFVLIILLILLARGIWVGFARQLASLLALLLAFVVAGRFYGESAALVVPYIKNQQAGFLIAYGLIFFLVFLTVHLLGLGLKKVMSISLLGWFDRALGGTFGLAKGLFLSSLLFMTMTAFLSDPNALFKKSVFAPHLEKSSCFIIHVIKNKNIRSDFLPRQPAISTMLTNSLKFNAPEKK